MDGSVTDLFWGGCSTDRPWCRSLWTFAATLLTGTSLFAQSQVPAAYPHQPRPSGVRPVAAQQVDTLTVSTDPRRPLDGRIEAMPRAEQKMEVIHHRSQLVVTRNPIRRIAWSDPNILDVVQFSETEISILGVNQGTTDLWIWFEGQETPLMYVVTVIRDPMLEEQRQIDYGRIERRLALLYPNSKVYLIPMSRKIIVRGQARDAEEAARIMTVVRGEVIAQEGDLYGYGDDAGFIGSGLGALGGYGAGYGGAGFLGDNFGGNGLYSSIIVDELQIPGEFQVEIRVRIAEVNRSQLRQLGVDWAAIINDGAVDIAQTFATGANPVLTGVFDSGNVTVLVDALASNGVAKIMHDARTVTLSGEPVAFLAGGEFAVPTIVGIGGAQGQQTSFRGFGTSIIATPTVVDHDLIRLQIVPELSVVNQNNSVGGIPGVDVRRVQTRVQLREGQSIVLGGLFSRQEAAEVSRIPFLGEIPIVGSLFFNAKRATEDESEMLIVVTPEIVRPMDPDQVPPLPGWYSTHPDDIDLYKYNRIEGNPDLGNYQLLPYGNGQGFGQDVGYNFYNPAPVDGQLSPSPTAGAPIGNGREIPVDPYNGFQGQQNYQQVFPQPTPQPAPPSYGQPQYPQEAPQSVPPASYPHNVQQQNVPMSTTSRQRAQQGVQPASAQVPMQHYSTQPRYQTR